MASVNIANDEQRIVIRTLNDQFRKTGIGGQMFLTAGVQALSEATRAKIMQAVREYDDFTEKNDPYGEHDFAAFEVDGHDLFWKIDYYDKDLMYLSQDASNTDLTTRVMTIMLSEEY